MGIPTDGDQIAAHYAAAYPALFMIIKRGTPHRPPVPGDVLSMAGHTGGQVGATVAVTDY